MRTFTTHCLVLACTLAACGGDGPGPVDSGLPADKSGKELTEDERQTFCEVATANLAARNTEAELKNFGCVIAGLTFAALAGGTEEECESVAEMCRDGAGEDGNDGGEELKCSLAAALPTCDAPVADIEACITEQNEVAADAIREASCADVGKMPTEVTDGPACAKIQSTCPSV